MTADRVVTASRDARCSPDRLFALVADPAQHPRWDGNDNLADADPGQRVRAVGDVFTVRLRQGGVRDNHVVEFSEGRSVAWTPSEPGSPPPGHLWRWELEPLPDGGTRVTHTYDWSRLADPHREAYARTLTPAHLLGSVDRLIALAGT